MPNNFEVTAGSGTIIGTDQAGDNSHLQIVKLAYSADGVKTLIPATANGLKVDIGASVALTVDASGTPVPVTDNGGSLTVDDGAGSLTVDAPVGTPVAVRLSDGASWITALPVTDNGATLSIDDGGAAISVDDNGGSLTVDGTVTGNQGTANTVANSWPVKVSDGTSTVGITDVAGSKALKVDLIQSVGTTKLQDEAGANFAESNPLPVSLVRSEQSRVTKQVQLTASQTAATLWDPAAGLRFVITGGLLSVTAAGDFRAFDETDAAANMLLEGRFNAGDNIGVASVIGSQPWPSGAIDQILKYTSGAGFAGELTLHGYEV
jgi:hypothetical protein